jgi:hypothetical protein
VSLDERVWAWLFRQCVHLGSQSTSAIRPYHNTLDALDTPVLVGDT